MIVTEITRDITGQDGVLSSTVRWEHRRGSTRIWFRFPGAYASYLTEGADPFLAATLLPSMALGERLLIEADVSPRLLSAVERIQALYAEWFHYTRIVPVTVGVRTPTDSAGAIGCFFSGGVDSFYSLLKRKSLYDGGAGDITHLIFIHGCDIGLHQRSLYRKVLGHIQTIAESAQKELLTVSTNLKQFGREFVSYVHYSGAILAAIGLACGGLFREVMIPSSFAQEQLHPWGSHPLLDPLWSTESTAVVHDGCEISRLRKTTEWICASDLALRHLRVCWKNRHGRYNCGECEKCLRTMIALYQANALARCGTFAGLSLSRLKRRLKLKSLAELKFAQENLEGLTRMSEKDDFTMALIEALQDLILQGTRNRTAEGRNKPGKDQ